MLQFILPEEELYNSANNEFFYLKRIPLTLEHSLISISKWESKWKKALINNMDRLSEEEFIDYIQCMIIGNVQVDPARLKAQDLTPITTYINDTMSATTFPKRPGETPSREIVTSEVIYSWMVELRIPFEPCEKWHINRLLTLIQICSDDRQPKKKMSTRDTTAMYARINAERRAKLHSKG